MPAAVRAWGLGAIAAAVSFAFSWVPSYWSDEVDTVRASSLRPAALLAFVTRHLDAAHALYYLAVHYWSGLFGFSELGTRSLSALGVGVATALTALIGQRLGRPRLALLAAALLAVMPRMTWAGTEARSYAWTAALAAAAWLLLLVALERGGWWWVGLGAVASISIATFLLTSTLLIAQLVYVLVQRRRAVLPLLAAWLAALVVASPVLYLGWRERGQVSWIGPKGAFTPWTVLVEPWGESSWGYGLAVWLVLIAGAVLWRRALRRACPEWLLLAGAWVVVPFAVTVGASLVTSPLFTARYLTFAMPGFAMLLAAALAALPPLRARGAHWLTAAAAIALLAISIPTYVGQRMPYAKPGGSDLRQLAQAVRTHAGSGDVIVFGPGPARGALAAYRRDFAGLDDVALQTPFPASGSFEDGTVPLTQRADLLSGHDGAVLVVAGIRSSCAAPADARTLLGDGFALAARYPTHREVVCRFERERAGAAG